MDQYGRRLFLEAKTARLDQHRVPDKPHVVHLQLELAVAQFHLDGEQAGYDVVREVGQLLRPHRRLVRHERRVPVQGPFLVDNAQLDRFREAPERVPEQQFVALTVAGHHVNTHRVRFRDGRPERRGLFVYAAHRRRPSSAVVTTGGTLTRYCLKPSPVSSRTSHGIDRAV